MNAHFSQSIKLCAQLYVGMFGAKIVSVELAPFGNIEIDGDKYPKDLSYSVSTVYCETPEEKCNPSPDIHLGLENTPVEGEKNKVAEKHCWKPDVQVKLRRRKYA
ncbi:hypothetical protein Avbf_10107 [Armadillidium vulgare]|nr:hypothetical protein Avbf_10107 [Armadillidium vulgare]